MKHQPAVESIIQIPCGTVHVIKLGSLLSPSELYEFYQHVERLQLAPLSILILCILYNCLSASSRNICSASHNMVGV